MNSVELITNESGDWVVLKVGGKTQYEGHNIPDHEWLKVVETFGASISSKEISDEEMENGEY